MIRLMAILAFVTVSNWLSIVIFHYLWGNNVPFRIVIWLCISLKSNTKVDRAKRLHILLVLLFILEVIIDYGSKFVTYGNKIESKEVSPVSRPRSP